MEKQHFKSKNIDCYEHYKFSTEVERFLENSNFEALEKVEMVALKYTLEDSTIYRIEADEPRITVSHVSSLRNGILDHSKKCGLLLGFKSTL